MATYVVGDIQGCFAPFQSLLDKVRFNPDKDRLWSVGDLVNRGPHNLETLRWFYAHRDNVTLVLGNHDLHLLAVSAGARAPSRKDNLDDILDAPDRETLIEWLHFQPLAYHESGVTMVHAGIPPLWSIEDTLQRAWEVETALQGARCVEFLTEMYGNDPYVWDDQLSGLTRLRVITNYLTRMRYCTRKGKLDLISKGPQPKPDALQGKKVAPWFSHKNRLTRGEKIIFGHWASLEGITDDHNTVALDTGCVWGHSLTLYHLETGERIACDCAGMSNTAA
jgi:bis(5'-nucleosyl)-tetraphosphatase (symmetrical)